MICWYQSDTWLNVRPPRGWGEGATHETSRSSDSNFNSSICSTIRSVISRKLKKEEIFLLKNRIIHYYAFTLHLQYMHYYKSNKLLTALVKHCGHYFLYMCRLHIKSLMSLSKKTRMIFLHIYKAICSLVQINYCTIDYCNLHVHICSPHKTQHVCLLLAFYATINAALASQID